MNLRKLRKLRELGIIENFLGSKVVLHGGKFYLEQKFYVNPNKLAIHINKTMSKSSDEDRGAPLCRIVGCAFNSSMHCKDIIGRVPSCRGIYQFCIMTRYSSLNTLFITSKLKQFII